MTIDTCDQCLQIVVEASVPATESGVHSKQEVVYVETLLRNGKKTGYGMECGMLGVSWYLLRHLQEVICQLGLLGATPSLEFGEVRQALEDETE
jgi:hypothetical protein